MTNVDVSVLQGKIAVTKDNRNVLLSFFEARKNKVLLVLARFFRFANL